MPGSRASGKFPQSLPPSSPQISFEQRMVTRVLDSHTSFFDLGYVQDESLAGTASKGSHSSNWWVVSKWAKEAFLEPFGPILATW